MLGQAVRRLLYTLPTLLCITAGAFVLLRAAPQGPFAQEQNASPAIEARLRAAYDRNAPIAQQFADYVAGLGDADLGPSMVYKDKDVAEILAEGAPTSALLALGATGVAFFFGGALGLAAAVRRKTAPDYLAAGLAVIGVCLSPLVIGPLLQLLFGLEWSLLPTSGLYRDEFRLQYLLLPIVALSLPFVAGVSQLMRASMIEALGSDAIRTARAKGLPEAQVVWRHALPVALPRVIQQLGPALAGVMAASFVIETVFQLPGIGKQFVLAASQRDYTLVMGVALVYSCAVVVVNLASDMVCRALDPRARRS